jgi:predicted TIM-barrel fold metal-dependent hydrolase
MFRVDVDAHIDETEATWGYLGPGEEGFRPVSVDPGMATIKGDTRPHRLWLIYGQTKLRRWRDDTRTGTTVETRELMDVDARVRHMDELRIDVQVLYPTMFLGGFTARQEVERALTRSYNRWIANATEKSGGRLRWVALLPMMSMDDAVEEVRWAKDHGACGVFKKGYECGRNASDPYFFPLYEEASRLDLPLCIHTGTGNPPSNDIGLDLGGRFNAISAFTDLTISDVPSQFPELRVGWIETGASWVPFLVADLMAKKLKRTFLPFDLQQDLFRRNRFYVACDSTDDLPYILQYGLEDNLIVGTDYTHADQSAELDALDIIEQKAATGVISTEVAQKIVQDNPRRFYGL